MQIDHSVLALISAISALINIMVVAFSAKSKARIDKVKVEQTDAQTDRLYLENFNKLFNNLITTSQEVVELKKQFADLRLDHDLLKTKLAMAEQDLSTERRLRLEAEAKLTLRDAKIVELEQRVKELESTLGIRVSPTIEAKPVNG